MDLVNKVCIVTGSAQGIGKAIARILLEKGCKVCISENRDSIEGMGKRRSIRSNDP